MSLRVRSAAATVTLVLIGAAYAEEIQRQSAEYREPSAALRDARQRHADAARAIPREAQGQSLARDSWSRGQGGTR